jgi:hypothetical protein
MLRKFWFANSRWSREICPCCGYRFELDDSIIRVTVGDKTEYFHEDCLKEMNGQEALEMFKAEIEIEEVEL